jgi:hypothetical protein
MNDCDDNGCGPCDVPVGMLSPRRHNFELRSSGQQTDVLVEDFGGLMGEGLPWNLTPIVWWWAWSNLDAGGAPVTCVPFFAPGAAAAAQDIIPLWGSTTVAPTLIAPTGRAELVASISQFCCCQFVPRFGERCGNEPWQLRITTGADVVGAWVIRGMWSWYKLGGLCEAELRELAGRCQ